MDATFVQCNSLDFQGAWKENVNRDWKSIYEPSKFEKGVLS
jgi:hypothetical protein